MFAWSCLHGGDAAVGVSVSWLIDDVYAGDPVSGSPWAWLRPIESRSTRTVKRWDMRESSRLNVV